MSTIGNLHISRSLARLGSIGFYSLHDIQSFNDTSENDVLSIKPLGFHSADEELRAVGVGSGVSLKIKLRFCFSLLLIRKSKLDSVLRPPILKNLIDSGTVCHPTLSKIEKLTIERTPGPV